MLRVHFLKKILMNGVHIVAVCNLYRYRHNTERSSLLGQLICTFIMLLKALRMFEESFATLPASVKRIWF